MTTTSNKNAPRRPQNGVARVDRHERARDSTIVLVERGPPRRERVRRRQRVPAGAFGPVFRLVPQLKRAHVRADLGDRTLVQRLYKVQVAPAQLQIDDEARAGALREVPQRAPRGGPWDFVEHLRARPADSEDRPRPEQRKDARKALVLVVAHARPLERHAQDLVDAAAGAIGADAGAVFVNRQVTDGRCAGGVKRPRRRLGGEGGW